MTENLLNLQQLMLLGAIKMGLNIDDALYGDVQALLKFNFIEFEDALPTTTKKGNDHLTEAVLVPVNKAKTKLVATSTTFERELPKRAYKKKDGKHTMMYEIMGHVATSIRNGATNVSEVQKIIAGIYKISTQGAEQRLRKATKEMAGILVNGIDISDYRPKELFTFLKERENLNDLLQLTSSAHKPASAHAAHA